LENGKRRNDSSIAPESKQPNSLRDQSDFLKSGLFVHKKRSMELSVSYERALQEADSGGTNLRWAIGRKAAETPAGYVI
jgi:hypothetical protein